MPRIGHGTLLQYGDGGSPTEVFTTIARLVTIGEFGGDVDDIDITNHDTVDAVREYTRGLAEPGEVPITGIWLGSASQLKVFSEVYAGIGPNENFKIVLPNSMGIFTFSGYIGGFRVNSQLDNRIEFSGRIKLSGKPTLTMP